MAAALLSLFLLIGDQSPARLAHGDRGLKVSLPQWILEDEEVLEQFKSGLTNTFRITAEFRTQAGTALKSAARLEIRYELWDEVFLIDVLEGDGKHSEHQVKDINTFRQWWKNSAFIIHPKPKTELASSVVIILDFIPFSRSEQDHARAWLTDSAKNNVRSGREQSSQVTSIFQTIMATSIQSKPLWSHRWQLTIP